MSGSIKDVVQKASEMRDVLRAFASENGGDASAFENDTAALEKMAVAMFNEAEGDAAVDFVTGNPRVRSALRLVIKPSNTADEHGRDDYFTIVQKTEAAARKEQFDCDEQGNKMPQAEELLQWVAKRMLFGFEDLSLLGRDMLGIVIDCADYIAISLKGAPDALLQAVLDNLTDRQKRMMIEDMEFLGPVTWQTVIQNRWKVLRLVDTLLDEGVLRLPKGGVAPSVQQRPISSPYLCNASMDKAVRLRRAIRTLILRKAKECGEDVEGLLGTYGTDADKEEAQKIEAQVLKAAAQDFCRYAVCGIAASYKSVTDERNKFRQALRNAPQKEIRSFAASLTDDNECLKRAIKETMVLFSDVLMLDDRSLQKMMRETDTEVLAEALLDADEDLKEKIYSDMSPRAYSELKEEMEHIRASVRYDEIASCQLHILDTIVRLEDEGEIAIRYDWGLYE